MELNIFRKKVSTDKEAQEIRQEIKKKIKTYKHYNKERVSNIKFSKKDLKGVKTDPEYSFKNFQYSKNQKECSHL